ncbi:MAG: heme ABC exporter ATP-binding protein CcmA [Nitratireductor sp.]|nr:heme ABC exporter ATP-binding protein CcmA [Nitratireductor sp.]
MRFEADSISVNRGLRRVVQDVSFSLGEGDVLTVTGANGAGKSTLLRALCGLLPLAEGKLRLTSIGEGEDDPLIFREHLHYLGPQNAMKAALSVRENLSFWRDFSGGTVGLTIEEALSAVELPHVADLPFSYLSTGMKRRVAICRLLVSRKPVWIVDEPTSGLDSHSSELFSALCRAHCADGGILIAATHLPLGLGKAQTLEMKTLYTFIEGDEFFDAEEDA